MRPGFPRSYILPDFRENTLRDVSTKLEPELFRAVTGLNVNDFHLLVRLKVFNTEQMNQAVFAFRRYKDAPCLLLSAGSCRATAAIAQLSVVQSVLSSFIETVFAITCAALFCRFELF